jgi:hypothetical protein
MNSWRKIGLKSALFAGDYRNKDLLTGDEIGIDNIILLHAKKTITVLSPERTFDQIMYKAIQISNALKLQN